MNRNCGPQLSLGETLVGGIVEGWKFLRCEIEGVQGEINRASPGPYKKRGGSFPSAENFLAPADELLESTRKVECQGDRADQKNRSKWSMAESFPAKISNAYKPHAFYSGSIWLSCSNWMTLSKESTSSRSWVTTIRPPRCSLAPASMHSRAFCLLSGSRLPVGSSANIISG